MGFVGFEWVKHPTLDLRRSVDVEGQGSGRARADHRRCLVVEVALDVLELDLPVGEAVPAF